MVEKCNLLQLFSFFHFIFREGSIYDKNGFHMLKIIKEIEEIYFY